MSDDQADERPPDPTSCGAKTRAGTPCQRMPAVGRKRCNLHGGKSPRWAASPNFKTGKYSKWLPESIRDRVTAASQDPELLGIAAHVALVDERLADLLRRWEAHPAGHAWGDAKAAFDDFLEAQANERLTSMKLALDRLEIAIGDGYADQQLWSEIFRTLEMRRRLTESERKRMVDMHQMVSSDEALGMMRAMLESIRRNVSDRGVLEAITSDFIAINGNGLPKPR